MSDPFDEPMSDVLLAIFTEIVRLAPGIPDDTGFALPHGVALEEILRRFQALPDSAGVAGIVEVLNDPNLPGGDSLHDSRPPSHPPDFHG